MNSTSAVATIIQAVSPLSPEALKEGLVRVESHDRDDETGLVSLAKVCHHILSNPSYTQGSVSNGMWAADRKIDNGRYFIHPVMQQLK